MYKKLKQFLGQWRGVLIATPTVAGLIIALRLTGTLQLLEWAALDQFFRFRPLEPSDRRIVIVAINELDIRKAGQWPISDAVLAKLLLKIKQQQPRAIGLNLFRDLSVPPGHEALVDVFESTPNLIGSEKVVGNAYGDSIAPPPALRKLNQVGAVNTVIDADGKVRRALLSVTLKNGETTESLATRLALIYLEAKGITLEEIDAANFKYRLGKAVFTRMKPDDGGYIGLDTGGYQILLNFRNHSCRGKLGKCFVYQTVSMTEVLEGRIPTDLMRDRIVLIGASAESLKDRVFTPYSNSPFTAPTGVELNADLTSQILSAAIEGRPLIHVWSEPGEWLWIFLWSFVGATVGGRLLHIHSRMTGIVLVGSTLAIGSFLAFLAGWWLPIVPVLLALGGSGVAITAYIAYTESEDRQAVMNLLGQHVSPKIAQAIWRDRNQLLKGGQLLGKNLTATVLFTDIKGFTTITEQTEPETLMIWLNEYMNVMAQSVLDHDGVVDKFIGDAVMAVFGIPIPSNKREEIAKDACAAVSCALDMGAKLKALNQQWQEKGLPTVAMRIGIATGLVVTGSVGSRERLNYTTIGDSVNIAARLESYDKSLDGGICRILIAEETHRHIQGKFPTQFIGTVQLKGRKQPVQIYLVPLQNADKI
ncbi:MAG TPA: adenylate/guanylate cyclase domain-containing protein [Cyanobacteria bacterium UBA8803]|nr:adenylate/guanylate cyclase domain-containing protein [Cyanobacteria bacterium UBA9273]HBL60431.1 adenylate/guanylate cyclase domain-containing protein [Cyanobacteria bacterium UBA8803]